MSETSEEPFDIEAERFLVQLQLALKLLTFEWEVNLELLATKLQELCRKYLDHLEKVKSAKVNGVSGVETGSTTVADSPNGTNGVPKKPTEVLVPLDGPDAGGETGGAADLIEPASQINGLDTRTSDVNDSTSDSEPSKTQIYDETLPQESCHLIISNPNFQNGNNSEEYKTWINENFIGVVDLALKNKSVRPGGDTEADVVKEYGDYTFTHSDDSTSETGSSRLYIRLENLTRAPLTVENVQYLMQNTLYQSTETISKFPGFARTEIIPVPNTEFQDAWDREILAEWYRGAALLWDGESFVEDSAAKGGSGGGAPPVAGLAGNLLGSIPLSSVAKSAAAITDVSAIADVATNIIRSDDEIKKESTIEAKVETKDQDGTQTTVEAKVEVKVSEVPDTAEGASTPPTSDAAEAGPSTSTIETVIEAVVKAGSEELEEATVESTAAIQKSEAALVESTVSLAGAQTSLVESAVALGKTEAVLAESKAAVTEVLESKAALVTSALDLGKSKDSLLKSAISLGKSKSSLFGTVLTFVDKTGEAFGVDLIDDRLYEDGADDGGNLTRWDKVKSEFPCPFDYPPDKEYKLKFTISIDDCLPSLTTAEDALSKIIDIHSPASAPPFDVTSIPGRYVLNKFLIATHRIVIAYICSENVVRYVTGIEADPAGGSIMSSGLDGLETALGFMGPNPAAMAAASVLKAGRSMAERKKKDAAAEFQRKSKTLLRKLWFLTTEVYGFLWFTKPQTSGKYEFDTAFHKASWKLVRGNRAGIYAEEEKPRLTTDVSEDYFIYLQEQTLMLREYTKELEVQAKEMMEELETAF
ncbi:uncharacterized protein DFL_009211 [Arthrobotrys flagrans]|uniref:Uncharacterized protein n=1 Tax=Arthrobotrys flagrans TaxID=97331 RepID=A0A436ZR61_ARTFL|nr:hypothetical protein DFL_009211 [Arthrobotrys flagrans]